MMADATLGSRLALCGEVLKTPQDVTELSHLRFDDVAIAEKHMRRCALISCPPPPLFPRRVSIPTLPFLIADITHVKGVHVTFTLL